MEEHREAPSRKISILGIPLDLGAGVRGARHAPDRIRDFLLPILRERDIEFGDLGNVAIPDEPEATDPRKKHYGEIEQACRNSAKFKELLHSGFPVVLGGDHAITICLVRSLSQGGGMGLIYFDAHGDFNTPETTPSGNIHGMVVSDITSGSQGNILRLVCDACPSVDESNVALIGIRDLDEEEAQLLGKSNVTVFDMVTIKKEGMEQIVERALALASRDTQRIHLSFDLDVADPEVTPAVSTPVPGGLTREEVFTALDLLRGRIASVDIVEYIPGKDQDGRTGRFAAEVVGRLL